MLLSPEPTVGAPVFVPSLAAVESAVALVLASASVGELFAPVPRLAEPGSVLTPVSLDASVDVSLEPVAAAGAPVPDDVPVDVVVAAPLPSLLELVSVAELVVSVGVIVVLAPELVLAWALAPASATDVAVSAEEPASAVVVSVEPVLVPLVAAELPLEPLLVAVSVELPTEPLPLSVVLPAVLLGVEVPAELSVGVGLVLVVGSAVPSVEEVVDPVPPVEPFVSGDDVSGPVVEPLPESAPASLAFGDVPVLSPVVLGALVPADDPPVPGVESLLGELLEPLSVVDPSGSVEDESGPGVELALGSGDKVVSVDPGVAFDAAPFVEPLVPDGEDAGTGSSASALAVQIELAATMTMLAVMATSSLRRAQSIVGLVSLFAPRPDEDLTSGETWFFAANLSDENASRPRMCRCRSR